MVAKGGLRIAIVTNGISYRLGDEGLQVRSVPGPSEARLDTGMVNGQRGGSGAMSGRFS